MKIFRLRKFKLMIIAWNRRFRRFQELRRRSERAENEICALRHDLYEAKEAALAGRGLAVRWLLDCAARERRN